MSRGNLKEFTKGIIRENPVLVLLLGTCPSLAVTTSAKTALGMGVAATVVLVCSNAVISMLRKVIPDSVRIPGYITIIAAFVSVVQMLIKAYLPEINDALGIYLPLIVVNCIILGRAEVFARKNRVLPSIFDGLGMGVGFTLALLAIGIIREFIGNGSIFDIALTSSFMTPIAVFVLPAGGFFVYGFMIAVVNRISRGKEKKKTLPSCMACPLSSECIQCKGGNVE